MLGSRTTVNVFKNVTLSNSPKQNKQERMKLKTKLHNWRVISFKFYVANVLANIYSHTQHSFGALSTCQT